MLNFGASKPRVKGGGGPGSAPARKVSAQGVSAQGVSAQGGVYLGVSA